MTPDKNYGIWTAGAGIIGGIIANVDTGIRTLLLTAAGALIALLLGLGYNSLMNMAGDLKKGQDTLRIENCQNYDKLDNRLRNVENTQTEVKTLVSQHLNESRGETANHRIK